MRLKRSSHCDFTPSFGRKKKRRQDATHSSVAAQTAAQFDTSFLGATRNESTGQKLQYRLMLPKSCDSLGRSLSHDSFRQVFGSKFLRYFHGPKLPCTNWNASILRPNGSPIHHPIRHLSVCFDGSTTCRSFRG